MKWRPLNGAPKANTNLTPMRVGHSEEPNPAAYVLGNAGFRLEVEAMLQRRAGPRVEGRSVAGHALNERQREMLRWKRKEIVV